MAGTKKKKAGKKDNGLTPSEPIQVNEADNDQLLDDLLGQLGDADTSRSEVALVVKEVNEQKAEHLERKSDSRSRFEARKARKAAEQAANHVDDDKDEDERKEREAKEEEIAINKISDDLGVTMFEINPDGHCLFAAVADQLRILNVLPPAHANYATTRFAASQYMFTHPDDFLPFLPSTEGEDGSGSTTGIMGPREFERYCAAIRDTGVWGGEPEILALSRAYNVPIHVIQAGSPPVVIHNPSNDGERNIKDKRAARISYHRRMYGLGEHYNSLRPKGNIFQNFLSHN